MIAGAGIAAGALGGIALARFAGSFIQDVRLPGRTDCRRRDDPGRGGNPRVADAGRARVTRGRHPGAAIRVSRDTRPV